MSTRIYVGNLGEQTTSNELSAIFAPHGTVQDAKVIADRTTGACHGYGFVEMSTEREAAAAIQALNGLPHAGRPLTVNEAKLRAPRLSGYKSAKRDSRGSRSR